jgi:hypothetical protein
VDIATGQVEDKEDDGKNAAATELGRKGGAARARNLTAERRTEITKRAAEKRWRSRNHQFQLCLSPEALHYFLLVSKPIRRGLGHF